MVEANLMDVAVKNIFELSREGACGVDIEEVPVFQTRLGTNLRENIGLPQVTESEVMRHYVTLSQKNYCIDTHQYPLGSCTMKYNPRVNEVIAREPGFANIHPLQPIQTVQGALELIYDLQSLLSKITGFPGITLTPAAGAHAEWVGLMMMKSYHERQGGLHKTKILIPDSAHGTNSASAALCGYEIVTIRTNHKGCIDKQEFDALLSDEVAGIMLTNPNTCGVFEADILSITDAIHRVGGLVYCDGANFNALVGKVKPADFGIDVMHLNLHKTFSTPHGGGGPGGGVICAAESLLSYLPAPLIVYQDGRYYPETPVFSIGRVKLFYGHFGVMVRALSYILSLGQDYLPRVAEHSVLNANYVLACLKDFYHVPYPVLCMHECLITDKLQLPGGVTAQDIAKVLLDYNIHPMTVYFPLVVKGAMLIEHPETETKRTLDQFVEVMRYIAQVSLDVEQGKALVKDAPARSTPVKRVDEVRAAREPVLTWDPKHGSS